MNSILMTHDFENGDKLILDVTTSYAFMNRLHVYSVCYLEENVDSETGKTIYNACNSDMFMSYEDAVKTFEVRTAAEKPYEAVGGDDTYFLVDQAIRRFLGDGDPVGHLIREADERPTDWSNLLSAVVRSMFDASDRHYYAGPELVEAMETLKTSSTKDSNGKADEVFEIPAWKLRELLVGIATLTMVIQTIRADSKQEAA